MGERADRSVVVEPARLTRGCWWERRQQQLDQQRQENERQSLAQQEQLAIQELQEDIGQVIAGDSRSFSLLNRSPNGVAAVYKRVNELSDQQYKESGRRQALSTKLLERAAAEVERDARAELQQAVSDPDVAAALGIGTRLPPRPNTLTNNMAQQQSPRDARTNQPETEQQKRERVQRMIEEGWRRRGPAR